MVAVLIIVLGFILVYINIKSVRLKQKSNFKRILHRKQKSLEYSFESAKITEDIEESIFELQKEIQDIKFLLKNKSDVKKDGDILDISFRDIPKLDKTQLVEYFIKSGLTDDDICNKLSLGKGELLLIKNILNK